MTTSEPQEILQLVEDLRRTSGSPEGKARLAVLEAVRHAVSERKVPNTSASYAAALLSAIQTSLSSNGQEEEMLAAIVFLLSHILSSLGDKLLRGKFIQMTEAVCAAVDRAPSSSGVARHGLQCLFVLLRAQEEVAWHTPQATEAMQRLVSHCADSRPKIRKAAQGHVLVFIIS
jgi:hypothetical protein